MSDVLQDLRTLNIIRLDRRVHVRADVSLQERDSDKPTVERLGLVLRRRQIIDAVNAESAPLDVAHAAVLHIETDPLVSNPGLINPGPTCEVPDITFIGEHA